MQDKIKVRRYEKEEQLMITVMTLPMALDPVVRLLGDERYTIGDQQFEMAMAAMQVIDMYHGEEATR